jgi:hypothetical protein
VIIYLNNKRRPSKLKLFIKTINKLNSRLSQEGRDLIFRSAVCINTNSVIKFIDQEDEHKDNTEAVEQAAATSSTLQVTATSSTLLAAATSLAPATSYTLQVAATSFTLLVSNSHNKPFRS